MQENVLQELLRNFPEDHPYMELYRNQKAVICCGQGAWEQPDTTWMLKRIFESKNLSLIHIFIVYAQELGVSDENLLRALTLSNLTTIPEKTPIGRLSAYCGAISAGAGAEMTNQIKQCQSHI